MELCSFNLKIKIFRVELMFMTSDLSKLKFDFKL